VDIPAPTHNTIFFGLRVLMYLFPSQLSIINVMMYSATPSRSCVVITFDMSNFVDRDKDTPINEDLFFCRPPFFGMQRNSRSLRNDNDVVDPI
jgi:hypothetical protein